MDGTGPWLLLTIGLHSRPVPSFPPIPSQIVSQYPAKSKPNVSVSEPARGARDVFHSTVTNHGQDLQFQPNVRSIDLIEIGYIYCIYSRKPHRNFQVITSRLKRSAPFRIAVRVSGKGTLRSVYAQATVQCPRQTEGRPSCSAACLPCKWRLVMPRIQH